jgi:hypothetical protein
VGAHRLTHALRRAAREKCSSCRGLRGEREQWGMALLESHEVAGFIVWLAVEPASMEDTDPFEGESTKRRLMGAAALTVTLVEGFGPEGARDGLAHPLDEGLALEGGAREAPVDPALVATALGDRGD